MTERNKKLSLAGRLRMVAACPDANASLCAEAADAIEQYEAFRQEVSDAVEEFYGGYRNARREELSQFIIAKPDPLVEAFDEAWPGIDKNLVEALRAAIEKRGGKIVWEQGND